MPVNRDIYQSLKKILIASGQLDVIVSAFVSNSESRLLELTDAIVNKNYEAALKITHAIKGSCAMIGGSHCAALCEAIEDAYKKSSDPELTDLLQKLSDEIKQISTFLKNDQTGTTQGCCE